MDPSDDLLRSLVGYEVAGYKLTAALGAGGMAAVFRGENTLNPGIVRAIKVVRPELASRSEFAKRFAQEAVILENLRHPNVVRFYGLRSEKGPQGNLLVMELELLEGETLGAMIARGGAAPSLRSAVSWMRAASEGVAAAHAIGIVHRDVKPDNVFLTTAGEIKVLDFGIAKAHDEADRNERLTAVGTVPGSPAYMAPEVWSGDVPGASADVYALGISLYEVLLGRHPFASPGERLHLSSPQLMAQHINRTLPPLREVRPDAGEGLEKVLARATAKDASWRYPTAAELAEALRGVMDEIGTGQPSSAGAAPVGTQFDLPARFDSKRGGAHGTPPASTLKREPEPRPSPVGKVAMVTGLVLVALAPAVYFGRKMASGHGEAPAPSASASAGPSATATASASAEAAPPEKNRWVLIRPTGNAVVLGVPSDKAPSDVSGFRPARKIAAPTSPYEIQQHEVTWEELDPWLAAGPDRTVVRPSWLPESPKDRAQLPATGVPWETARAYCQSIGGSLPSEEEWEYAARGSSLRPYAWGAQRLDLARTRAYARTDKGSIPVAPVGTMEQDQTPGGEGEVLEDMTGNALEWTADLYREDRPKQDERWTEAGGKTYRAVRGLPLDKPPPAKLPAEGAAVRDALCATGPCPKATADLLQYVGFRCKRKAKHN